MCSGDDFGDFISGCCVICGIDRIAKNVSIVVFDVQDGRVFG